MTTYNVFLNDKQIDTVFYSDCNVEYVTKSLINHDGYDSAIVVVNPLHVTEDDFDSIDSNGNGHPRYVCHFLALVRDLPAGDINNKYLTAVARSKDVVGSKGKKYHNKSYGGGVCFVSWEITDTIEAINNMLDEVQ